MVFSSGADKLKEDQAHVFKRFYRTKSANKGFRGFGVG
ncbi:ATP-binding protein [Pedobacter sp. PF22-3]|nr:ATP-binding protein [Pedobacter sp. PF22-3]MCX2493874.1 ATP-binding protein [Pedobacter sp. PF22-3]